MPTLRVIVASTRRGRVGLPVAERFIGHAGGQETFEVEVVDLAELNLPLLNEPDHPPCAGTPRRTRSPGALLSKRLTRSSS